MKAENEQVHTVAQQEQGHEDDKSLNKLLMALTEVDNSIADVDYEVQADLFDKGKIKVDSYKYLIDKLDAQAEYFERREKEYYEAKKHCQNASRRLKDQLTFALQNNGWEKFTGHEYVVALRKSKPSVVLKAEATPKLRLKYPELIETEYKWKKTAVGDLLRTQPDHDIAELASLKESVHVRFSLNKGTKK